MEQNTRFYICPICGNQIGMIRQKGPKVVCCGREMLLMEANKEGAPEKHIPVCKIEDNKVYVDIGEVMHPMDVDHYIEWVAIVGENQTTRVAFRPGQEPKAVFEYIPHSTVYAYCNKHGLWKLEKID